MRARSSSSLRFSGWSTSPFARKISSLTHCSFAPKALFGGGVVPVFSVGVSPGFCPFAVSSRSTRRSPLCSPLTGAVELVLLAPESDVGRASARRSEMT